MDTQLDRIQAWLARYLSRNASPKAPVIVGLSGGKDSTMVAAVCKEVAGADRVIGISLPDAGQNDEAAREIAETLGIRLITHDISKTTKSLLDGLDGEISTTVLWNLAPRVRMTALYMYANQLGGRVANTCNMSETYVGYDTRWGDQCGDFSLFQNYTATEILEMGYILSVPDRFLEVPPADGLCGMTDEERWGFTYAMLDNYLRGGEIPAEVAEKIEAMHERALYKIRSVRLPAVPYSPPFSKKLC